MIPRALRQLADVVVLSLLSWALHTCTWTWGMGGGHPLPKAQARPRATARSGAALPEHTTERPGSPCPFPYTTSQSSLPSTTYLPYHLHPHPPGTCLLSVCPVVHPVPSIHLHLHSPSVSPLSSSSSSSSLLLLLTHPPTWWPPKLPYYFPPTLSYTSNALRPLPLSSVLE